jgi:hypothetical protein
MSVIYILFVLGQKLKCRALLSANIPLKKHLTNPAVLLLGQYVGFMPGRLG